MAIEDKPKPTTKIGPSQKRVLDLKGSEQHHDLKKQPGKKGVSDHRDPDAADSGDVEELVEGALSDNEEDTSMFAALKKVVE